MGTQCQRTPASTAPRSTSSARHSASCTARASARARAPAPRCAASDPLQARATPLAAAPPSARWAGGARASAARGAPSPSGRGARRRGSCTASRGACGRISGHRRAAWSARLGHGRVCPRLHTHLAALRALDAAQAQPPTRLLVLLWGLRGGVLRRLGLHSAVRGRGSASSSSEPSEGRYMRGC